MHDEFIEVRDAARRALSGAFSLDELRAADSAPPELVQRLWNVAIEAGWTGLLIPEEAGGVGLGMAAGIVVAEELGRSLAPGAWGASLALAPCLGLEERKLASLAAGEMRVSLAFVHADDNGRLQGLVDYASTATHFLTVTPGAHPAETYVFDMVSAGEMVIAREHQPLDPGTPIATVYFPKDGTSQPVASIERAFDAFRVFMAAQLVGIARRSLELSVEYAKTRTQFGVAIGSFQAIKHCLADIAIATDAAAMAVLHAARTWDAEGATVSFDCLAAYELAVRAACDASARGIQIHGAIGVSWEHDLHLFLKRSRAIKALLAHPALGSGSINLG